tara:strand:- start:987 stop:1124 length:138 start_codon:yes stop_codon:yes gene_type:complete
MDGVLAVIYLIGGLFGLMMSFYLALCFIQWISDVVEHKQWRYWFK